VPLVVQPPESSLGGGVHFPVFTSQTPPDAQSAVD
jgi:hypothetical protein